MKLTKIASLYFLKIIFLDGIRTRSVANKDQILGSIVKWQIKEKKFFKLGFIRNLYCKKNKAVFC